MDKTFVVYYDLYTIPRQQDSRYYKARVLGQDFARNYPESLKEMKGIQENLSEAAKGAANSNNDVNTESKQSDPGQLPGAKHNISRSASHAGVSTKSLQYHTMSSSQPPPDGGKSTMRKLVEKISLNKSSKKSKSENNSRVNSKLSQDTIEFMKGMMDECTHLGNFSMPVDPSLIIIVAAKLDGYVPRDKVISLEDIWPGSEVRYIKSGHVSAFLLKQETFRWDCCVIHR